MPGLLLAAMLAAAQPAPARGNLVFARGHLDGWSLQAINVVTNHPSSPTIDRMRCTIERNGLNVMTRREGNVSFLFSGSVARGGREHRILSSKVRRLEIDGVGYEVEPRYDGALTDRYTDVVYPESQNVYPPGGTFFVAVRRDGGDLWLRLDNVANELIEARLLRVGFRDEVGGPLHWIDVPLTGLPAALAWCHTAMTSPDALRLNAR